MGIRFFYFIPYKKDREYRKIKIPDLLLFRHCRFDRDRWGTGYTDKGALRLPKPALGGRKHAW